MLRRAIEEVRDAERSRFVRYWYSGDGTRFGMETDMPAAGGVVIEKALDHLVQQIPVMPGEEGEHHVGARRADALVMLASTRVATDQDPDRSSVVVHVRHGGFGGEDGAAELEDGPVIHPETARRLMCAGALQWLLEDDRGDVLRLRGQRKPPRWMVRALKHRDRECRFHGCGSRRYLQAHHIRHWEQGGPTELDNLLLVCFFRHKLVHEYGWRILRGAGRHGDLVPAEREAVPAWTRATARAIAG